MGDGRVEALLPVVAAACPELLLDELRAALEATITNPVVARCLTAALKAGPAVLAAGAPPVVGRLVDELRARGLPLRRRPVRAVGEPAGPSCGWEQPGSAHAVAATSWPRPARGVDGCE